MGNTIFRKQSTQKIPTNETTINNSTDRSMCVGFPSLCFFTFPPKLFRFYFSLFFIFIIYCFCLRQEMKLCVFVPNFNIYFFDSQYLVCISVILAIRIYHCYSFLYTIIPFISLFYVPSLKNIQPHTYSSQGTTTRTTTKWSSTTSKIKQHHLL